MARPGGACEPIGVNCYEPKAEREFELLSTGKNTDGMPVIYVFKRRGQNPIPAGTQLLLSQAGEITVNNSGNQANTRCANFVIIPADANNDLYLWVQSIRYDTN